MGYESYVQGIAKGAGLVGRLSQSGFTVEDGILLDPNLWPTGLAVVDRDTLKGTEEWAPAYGFDDLVEALRWIEELVEVDLACEGEDSERERHVYRDGRWYALLSVEACVEEGREEQARAAALQALAPYALPA